MIRGQPRSTRTNTLFPTRRSSDLSFIDEARQSLARGALVGRGDAPVSFVARDDIAAAAAGILAGQGHEGAIYQGTGPATWSGKERAAAVSTASGKPLDFVALPEEQFAAGLAQAGLPDEIANVEIGRASCRERVCQYV